MILKRRSQKQEGASPEWCGGLHSIIQRAIALLLKLVKNWLLYIWQNTSGVQFKSYTSKWDTHFFVLRQYIIRFFFTRCLLNEVLMETDTFLASSSIHATLLHSMAAKLAKNCPANRDSFEIRRTRIGIGGFSKHKKKYTHKLLIPRDGPDSRKIKSLGLYKRNWA